MSKRVAVTLLAIAVVSIGVISSPVSANNAWGTYHWARTANPLTLNLGDNLSSTWDQYLTVASADWSTSAVLTTSVVMGGTNPKVCRPNTGRVEVCNYKYGNNGWLGIASVWVNGSHITQGTVKLNDTYFLTAKYNTPAWKQFVTCQEIGHTFGLNHQDEAFDNANLGSCMDYTNDPTTNQHPNTHDFDMLSTIYSHLDTSNTSMSSTASAKFPDMDSGNRSEWGRSIRTSQDGRSSLFERDLGHGRKVFTFVVWAD